MKPLLLLTLLVFSLFAYAQAPSQINYQGVARNAVGNVLPNKNITVRLSVKDGQPNGTTVYTETRSITTNNFGLFNIAIGSNGATGVVGNLNAVSWQTGTKYLQVEMDPNGGTSFLNLGSSQLLSVPYSLYAANAGSAVPSGPAGGVLTGAYPNPSIADGTITNTMIAPGVIPTALPPSGVAGGDLNGNYPNPLINNAAITTSKIADDAVVTSKLQDLSITNTKLSDNVVSTSKIQNAAVTNTKLADNAVTTSKVMDGSITMAKLGPDVVFGGGGSPTGAAGGELSGTYPNPTIANNVITTAKLADNAVSTSKIQDASVTSVKLAAGVIPTTLPPSGIAGGELSGTYPNPTIANNVITNTKLADNAVTTSKVMDGSITLAKLGPDVVLGGGGSPTGAAGGELSGTYPNPTIANGIITNTKLADNAVSTSKIQDGSVTNAKLAAGIIPTALPPSGTAGGDLSGNYPAPMVSKLRGISIGVTTPANGQVLKYNGTEWIPSDDISGPGGSPSGQAGGDLSGTYPNPNIASGSVTNSKIANGAVITPKLADGAVNSNKLADNAVTTSKVMDGSITMAKLGPDVVLGGGGSPSGAAGGELSGTYPNPTIANGVITNTKLADNAVSTSKIQDASVTNAKLAAGIIPTTLPPSGAAGGELSGTYPNPTIANNVITNTKLVDNAVGTSKIQNVSITNAKLADNAVTTSKVMDGSITMAKLGPDVVLGGGGSPTGAAGGELSGTYPNPTIANGIITNTKLADNAVSTSKIQDGSVTNAKLAVGVIPTTLPPSGTAGGDLSGTYPNPIVNKLQGVALNNVAPANGQVLKFNGTEWIPSTDLTGGGGLTLPYSSAVTNSNALFSLTNQGTGAAIEATNSTNSNNATGLKGQISSAAPGTDASAVRGINNGANAAGHGVWGSHNGAGNGLYGTSASGNGIKGSSTSGPGVFGTSNTNSAGYFDIANYSSSSDALMAYNVGAGSAATAISENGNGLWGITFSPAAGAVLGYNLGAGEGVVGRTTSGTAAAVVGKNEGVFAAVQGISAATGGTAVLAQANVGGTTGGNALVAAIEGTASGNPAVFKANAVNVARIDHTGKGFFNGGTQVGGADLAEYFEVEGDRNIYEEGDVLIISANADRKVEKSTQAYSTLVAGVFATKPGLMLTDRNAEQDDLNDMVPMGVIGVVPTKVCNEGGAIKRGDLLVTSSISGVAMKADIEKVKIGQVLGKALQDYNNTGIGKINVLVSVK